MVMICNTPPRLDSVVIREKRLTLTLATNLLTQGKIVMKIQKYILIVLTFFTGIVPVMAQEKKPILPAGAQTVIIDGPSGTEYVSAAGRFKIRFPGVPQEFEGTYDTKLGQIASHLVMLAADITHAVNYTDYPMNIEQPELVKGVLDNARDGGLARVAKEEPRILSETDVSIEGHPARFLRVELKGDAIIRYKFVVVGNRVYVLSVGTPKRPDAQAEYERLATTFFDSFKLMTPLEADLAETWREFSFAEGKFKIKFPGTPYQAPLELRKQLKFQVAGYQSAGSYSARYLEFSEIVKDPAALRVFLDNMRDAELEYLEQRGKKPKVLSETDITYDRYLGRMLVLELPNNVIYRNKTIVVNNRLYVLTTIIPKVDAQSTVGNAYEQLVMRFIDSFSLIPETGKHQ
jgi:hypothetical protein